MVEGIIRNNSAKLFDLDQKIRCCVKDFLSRAPEALLIGGAEPFVQFCKFATFKQACTAIQWDDMYEPSLSSIFCIQAVKALVESAWILFALL